MITDLKNQEYYTINLLPKWCEFDLDEDMITEYIRQVEFWQEQIFDSRNPNVWVWKYDPAYEYQNQGIIGIVFTDKRAAESFKDIFIDA